MELTREIKKIIDQYVEKETKMLQIRNLIHHNGTNKKDMYRIAINALSVLIANGYTLDFLDSLKISDKVTLNVSG